MKVVPPGDQGSEQTAAWQRSYSPDAGLPFDAEDLERRIVWIWGSVRSGSTWLTRLLTDPADPDPRESLGFSVRPGGEPLLAVPFNEFLISGHIAPKRGRPNAFGDALIPATLNVLLGSLESYALADRFADVWGPELRRTTLVRIAAGIDRATACGVPLGADPLVVIKEVSGSHAADVVMKLFPRSRMIFLVRDGRDIVDSRVHALGEGGWKVGRNGPRFGSRRERLDFVRDECLDWACVTDVVGSAYEHHPSGLRFRLRYEDLRYETAARLTEVRAWMGLPSEPELVEAIADRHAFENVPAGERGSNRAKRAARPGLWRKNLTRRERREASELLVSRLISLGYEP